MILECYALLKTIEQRPGMWIGEVSLKNLNTYLNGYCHALSDYKIEITFAKDEPFFDWVAKKLGYFESTAGWANMILAHCMGYAARDIDWEDFLASPVTREQHLESVRYFYELVEIFKKDMEGFNNTIPKQP